MKQVLVILAATVMTFVLGRMLVLALVSDETKITWLIEGMEEGYNEGDLSDCIGPLHDDWRHDGYSVNREYMKGGLFRAFREERDGETHERTSKVEIVGDGPSVEVTGDTARVEVEARFSRMRGDAWEETWHIRVFGDLEQGEDGWKIVHTRHDDVKGTQLSR
jgi:hypothetical protein